MQNTQAMPTMIAAATRRRWFAPPHFSNPEQTRNAQLIWITLLVSSVGLAIGYISVLVNLTNSVIALVPLTLLSITNLVAGWALWRGKLSLAAWWVIFPDWLILLTSTVLANGFNNTNVMLFMVVLVLTRLVLGGRVSLVMTGITFIYFLILLVDHYTWGMIPLVRGQSPFSRQWVGAVFAVGSMLTYVHIAVRSLDMALARANRNERELIFTLTELQTSTVHRLYVDSIIESMLDMLIVLDIQLVIRRVNRRTLESLGYTEAELIGKKFSEILRDDKADIINRLHLDSTVDTWEVSTVAVYHTATDRELTVLFAANLMNVDGVQQEWVCIAQDISQRIKAEQALEAERNRLRTLIDTLPDLVYVKDKARRFIVANRRANERFGLPPDSTELLGKTSDEMELPQFVSVIREEDNSVLSGTAIIDKPIEAEFADNVKYSLLITKLPLYDEVTGQITGLLEVVRDITAQSEAQKALVAEQNLLRTILDSLPDYVHVKDVEGRYLLSNRAHMALLGVTSPEDFVGKHSADFFGQEIAAPYLVDDDYIRRTGQAILGVEHRGVDQQGNTIHFLSNKVPLRAENGELIGIVAIATDITIRVQAEEALRESEARLRKVVESAPVFIFAIDTDYRLTFFDGQGDTDASIDEVGQALGRTLFQPNPNGQEVHIAQAVERAFAGETQQITLQLDRLAFDIRYSPMTTRDGEIAGIIGVATDITDKFRAEQEIREYARALERSNQELQDFAYVASHDLQEPLRKIQAFGDRLVQRSQGQLDETSLDYLARMHSAANRMQSLIRDLLMFSRVTTQAQPFALVNLNEIMADVRVDLEVPIEQTHAIIRQDDLPSIAAERSQMRQLFTNLIGNSLKYARVGVPPEISVTTTDLTIDGVTIVRIRIQDNGIGFEDKYAERIFGVFQRLHSRTEYEGTGMGLAICRKIVERHGGTIVAHGELHVGAIFTIDLPLQPKLMT